eukprot:scaffold183901_cov24-Attheya_sp.AAC.1
MLTTIHHRKLLWLQNPMLLPATRLVVKGVGIKVDGRRSNKKETISWSLSILFLDDGDDECGRGSSTYFNKLC